MIMINTYMRNYFKTLKKNVGFTLIELLVVIGILGILAAALVATIDPFEQLKKGQDANVQNTLAEYLSADVRYYTTHNALPWVDTNNTVYQTSCATAAGFTSSLPTGATLASMGSATSSCLGALINDGELKSGFAGATSALTSILVSGTTNSVTACFQPQSKSFRNNPLTKWNSVGAATVAGCPNATLSTCYWCSN